MAAESDGQKTTEYTKGKLPAKWPSMASWPLLIFFLFAIVSLTMFRNDSIWNPPGLLPALNVIFLTSLSYLVSIIAARSYLHSRSLAVLFLGCGTISLGTGALMSVVPAIGSSSNTLISIYNSSALVAGICHLFSVAVLSAPKGERKRLGRYDLPLFYSVIIIIEVSVTTLVLNGMWPPFFIPGSGQTDLGLSILYLTIITFSLSGILLGIRRREVDRDFGHWYSFGLGLIAVGLIGVSLQSNLGDPLNWTGRLSQYAGMVFMLIAVIVAARKSGSWLLPLEEALKESEGRYQSLVTLSPDAILVQVEGRFTFANPAAAKLFGLESPAMLIGRKTQDLIPEGDREEVDRYVERIMAGDSLPPHRIAIIGLDGRHIDAEITSSKVQHGNRPATQSIIRDVTERARIERERDMAAEFLHLINDCKNTDELVHEAIEFIRERSGCEAVGIRIHKEGDYPYYGTSGFPPGFVMLENHLCDHSTDDRPFRFGGNPVLECMCGNVIQGKFDPTRPFFTHNGSFWTNSTTKHLAEINETERQSRTRNGCNGEGYESVALVPLRSGKETLGLIQMNDRRKDRFTPDLIAQWERLSGYLTVALAKFQWEDALRESEAKYRGLFYNMQEEVHFWKLVRDDEGNIRTWRLFDVNPPALKTWGKDLNDILGKTTDEIFGLGAKDHYMPIVKKVFDENEPYVYEDYFPHLDRFFHFATIPFGEYFITTGLDISDIKKAQCQTEEERGRLQAILDNLPVGVVVVDNEGRTSFANKAMRRIWGGSKEIDGMEPDPSRMRAWFSDRLESVRPEDWPFVDAVKEGKESIPRIIDIESYDGSNHTLLVTAAPLLDKDGNTIGGMSVRQDVTEMKETEKALQRSNIELQQFAYVASHDLQEPLRMVLSYVTLLNKRHEAGLGGDSKEYLRYINEGAERMRQLVNDLLQYSRIDTATAPFTDVDMGPLTKKVIDMVKVAAEERGVMFEVGPLPMVKADGSQMLQLMQNLISNAIKFHGKESPIVRISSTQNSKEWKISVQDNGIGIDPKYNNRLFQMFQRLHTRDEFEGTGIGLAVCKKIIDRHGGRIWVDSEEGKGATFFFTLPKNGPKQ
jgi:PAS domain S-box-containing protein